jgi:cytochrome P450
MNLIANWKNAFDRLEAEGLAVLHEIEDEVTSFLDRLKQHLVENPEPIFAILRRVAPILVVKNTAIVTRFEDVQEVLSRDQVFQVTYQDKMEVVAGGPNFFLGMQNSPAYERDHSHMLTVIRRQDIPEQVAPFVAAAAESLVKASDGEIEVVSQLAQLVPTRWIAKYFGCPSPSDADLVNWSTATFQYLFADLNDDATVAAAARDAAAKTRAWLDSSIAKRKVEIARPGAVPSDDVLNRCLALQNAGVPGMDDVTIRTNLLGLFVGAIPTTSKCCTQALDELLKRPEDLARAQQAAASDNDALLADLVFEALRFNPNNPVVVRVATEEYTLAKGSMRETLIPKGATAVAATQSAMFDDRFVEVPNEIRTGRPSCIYMHFGYGLHTCFGQYINRVQIPGILKPLLRRKNLRRAAGAAGQLTYSGPFPSSMTVQFER